MGLILAIYSLEQQYVATSYWKKWRNTICMILLLDTCFFFLELFHFNSQGTCCCSAKEHLKKVVWHRYSDGWLLLFFVIGCCIFTLISSTDLYYNGCIFLWRMTNVLSSQLRAVISLGEIKGCSSKSQQFDGGEQNPQSFFCLGLLLIFILACCRAGAFLSIQCTAWKKSIWM